MKVRILTALVLLCVLVPVLIFSGTVVFPFVAAFFSVVAVSEMQKCLGTWNKLYVSIPACLLSALLPLGLLFFVKIGEGLTVSFASPNHGAMYLLVFAAVFVLFMFYLFAAAVFCRGSLSFSDVSAAFVTTFYITLAFLSILILRFGTNGQYYYLLCFLGAWITDSFAYFTGVFFGRHKLIPEISPKKTVEGSIGGILACGISFMIYGVAIAHFVDSANRMHLGLLFLYGVVVSVVSQIGDLSLSAVKRQYGIKDFGRLFPGHGGVLDRFDSIMSVSLVLFVLNEFSQVFR